MGTTTESSAIELTSPGMVAQALRVAAEAKRRESRRRDNAGVELTEHRAKLRARAVKMEAEADSIEDQLRAKHHAQAKGHRRLQRLHQGRP